MPAPPAIEGPPSLLGPTIRRSIFLGRYYLILGIGYSVLFGIIFSVVASNSFSSTVPVILPIFGVIGAMGGLLVFTNDRLKGVYEYLIAYGISPRQLFVNVLVASIVLATIVLGTSLAVGLGLLVARGNPISPGLAASLGIYTIPMTYGSVVFAATVGMFWTSLSSPRGGMSSPLGFIPLVGIAPAILTLISVALLAAAGFSAFYVVVGVAVALIVVLVLVLLSQIGRLMPLERLLSPV